MADPDIVACVQMPQIEHTENVRAFMYVGLAQPLKLPSGGNILTIQTLKFLARASTRPAANTQLVVYGVGILNVLCIANAEAEVMLTPSLFSLTATSSVGTLAPDDSIFSMSAQITAQSPNSGPLALNSACLSAKLSVSVDLGTILGGQASGSWGRAASTPIVHVASSIVYNIMAPIGFDHASLSTIINRA